MWCPNSSSAAVSAPAAATTPHGTAARCPPKQEHETQGESTKDSTTGCACPVCRGFPPRAPPRGAVGVYEPAAERAERAGVRPQMTLQDVYNLVSSWPATAVVARASTAKAYLTEFQLNEETGRIGQRDPTRGAVPISQILPDYLKDAFSLEFGGGPTTAGQLAEALAPILASHGGMLAMTQGRRIVNMSLAFEFDDTIYKDVPEIASRASTVRVAVAKGAEASARGACHATVADAIHDAMPDHWAVTVYRIGNVLVTQHQLSKDLPGLKPGERDKLFVTLSDGSWYDHCEEACFPRWRRYKTSSPRHLTMHVAREGITWAMLRETYCVASNADALLARAAATASSSSNSSTPSC